MRYRRRLLTGAPWRESETTHRLLPLAGPRCVGRTPDFEWLMIDAS